ncbi:ATP-binding protein [Candidatus Saccharibacteria bacterium]|nr:ATP-binding protein [Candidatus Saccharibacteria bacterium]
MKLRVESVCHSGPQNFTLSGLPNTQIKDARDKIRSLMHRYCNWKLLDRIVVNLAPAEIEKKGAHLELPIFLSVAILLHQKNSQPPHKGAKGSNTTNLISIPPVPICGSLDLEGNIHHTSFTRRLHREGIDFIGPHNCKHISELLLQLKEERAIRAPAPIVSSSKNKARPDSQRKSIHVEGRLEEKLALFCAAIGQTPVLLLGPPGVGKSHLAKWASTIYPSPQPQEQSMIEKIWARYGLKYYKDQVPSFFPHSRSHIADFVGRKNSGRSLPGYFSLSHHGILVLDEFPELARDAREIFRTVLEEKYVNSLESSGIVRWPAEFWFIATANPCPCGYSDPNSRSQCQCSYSQWKAYQQRLSGPLIDRFAIKLYLDQGIDPGKVKVTNSRIPDSILELLSNDQKLLEKIAPLRNEWSHHRAELKKLFQKHSNQCRSRSHDNQGHIFSILKVIGLTEQQAMYFAQKWNQKIQFHA